jgi:hypothetical protein
MTNKTNEDLLAEVLTETRATMALSAAVVHAQGKLDESPDASGVMVQPSALRALLAALKAPAPRERFDPEVKDEAVRRVQARIDQMTAAGRPEAEINELRQFGLDELAEIDFTEDPEVWEMLDALMFGGR